MARITGLGGIFYKVEDPERTRAWYKDKLGIGGEWGATFPWKADASGEAFSLVSPFKAASDYFDPSRAGFMINLRVDDLEAMMEELKAKDVAILGTQYEDYGKFAWILDCDGIKIELWEQIGPAPEG
ncbi:MAG TPA: VOC family protein [Allosphingosinicella sp.]|nr:VOC family protein [Allosphingosinicella sp.]